MSSTIAAIVVASCAHNEIAVTEPHYDCKAENSIALDLDKFVDSPLSYAGRCVTAQGYVSGQLFSSLERYYSEHRNFPFGLPPNRIVGLNERGGAGATLAARQYVQLTGLAVSCRQLNAVAFAEASRLQREAKRRGSDDIFLTFGYGGWCHYSEGPAIYVSEWKTLPGAALYLSGAEADRKYRNIFEMTASDEHTSEIRTEAIKWFDAVRNRDDEQWAYPGYRDVLVDNARSPVSFLWGAAKSPEIHFFRVKPVAPRSRADAGYLYKAYGCVCKVDNCEGRWPIVGADAVLSPNQPYACIEVFRYRGPNEPVTVTYKIE